MKHELTKRPLVGVGAIVLREGKVLLGKRKSSHGEGTWCFPGGHLEFGEAPEECAIREVYEEAGITIKNVRRGPFTNDFFEQTQKHYITIYMIADFDEGEVRVMEPEKCEQWQWFSWNDLPQPLFLPLKNFRASRFNPSV